MVAPGCKSPIAVCRQCHGGTAGNDFCAVFANGVVVGFGRAAGHFLSHGGVADGADRLLRCGLQG
jgi:hypothetical protein